MVVDKFKGPTIYIFLGGEEGGLVFFLSKPVYLTWNKTDD